jgi:hypothetical protein
MSWPINAECPDCFGITGWYARYTSPKNRCQCEREIERDELPAELKRTGTGGWQ